MQVELNHDEIQVLCKALEVYEKEPIATSAVTNIMMALMMGNKDSTEGDKLLRRKGDEASAESAARHLTSIVLQAKLLQAAAKSHGDAPIAR